MFNKKRRISLLFRKINIFKFSTILCFAVFIIFVSTVVQANFIIKNDIEIINNSVSGPGSDNSIFSEGVSYNGKINLTKREKLDKYDFLFNMDINTREDTNFNQELTLSRLRARFKSQENGSVINIGDTFEFFDQYVLNSSLKGLSYKQKINDINSISLVYGYNYSAWKDILSDNQELIERKSWGVNYKNNSSEIIKWGFSLLNTNDQGNVDTDEIFYDNNVYGLNWEYIPMAGLTVKGSSAYGDTEESSGSSYSGAAHKLKIFSSAREGKASIDYERVEPDFKTLLGSATSDKEKYKFSLLYRYSKKINYNFDYIYFHDNLAGQKEDTSYNYKPGVGVSIKRLFNRRYASANIKYNYKGKTKADKEDKNDIYSINYRDRFKLIDVNMNLNYTKGELKDNNDFNGENELSYNLSLATRKRMENYILRPVLRFGYFNSNDEDEGSNNTNFEKSLEMGLNIPDKKISSNLKFGEKEALNDNAEDNNKFFVTLNFNIRPVFLEKYKQGRLYLKFRYNDLQYSESEDKNFTENSLTIGANFGF